MHPVGTVPTDKMHPVGTLRFNRGWGKMYFLSSLAAEHLRNKGRLQNLKLVKIPRLEVSERIHKVPKFHLGIFWNRRCGGQEIVQISYKRGSNGP